MSRTLPPNVVCFGYQVCGLISTMGAAYRETYFDRDFWLAATLSAHRSEPHPREDDPLLSPPQAVSPSSVPPLSRGGLKEKPAQKSKSAANCSFWVPALT